MKWNNGDTPISESLVVVEERAFTFSSPLRLRDTAARHEEKARQLHLSHSSPFSGCTVGPHTYEFIKIKKSDEKKIKKLTGTLS